MNRAIWLVPTEPKCIASACRLPLGCARRDVSAQGRPLTDYSVGAYGGTAECAGPGWAKRINPEDARKPAEARPVREWIGSGRP